jgi:hypothetical protein
MKEEIGGGKKSMFSLPLRIKRKTEQQTDAQTISPQPRADLAEYVQKIANCFNYWDNTSIFKS